MRYQIGEIIDYLSGTCKTLDEACEAILGEGQDATNLSKEETSHIDDSIFCCSDCDWWTETQDMAEDKEGVCINCLED